MEKEQNTNSENQDKEAEEIKTEEQNNETQPDDTSENQDKEAEEIKTEEQNNETQPDDTSENKEEIKELTPEEKIKELEDKVARALAEMENQRRRFEKEKDDAFDYGGFSFAKEALNLIDNLERSRQILESDEILKDTEALKKTLEHFEIISKDMVSIFSKNGITPIVSVGKKLDPNKHQAMMEIDDDQKEPGTIVQEIQKGFMMKDRLLRPALVSVSKKTKIEKEEKNEENKENSDN
jgi:molecular chaperone GrpE